LARLKALLALFFSCDSSSGSCINSKRKRHLYYETIQEGGGIPSGNASDIFTLADSDEEDAVAQSLAMFKGYD